MKKNVLAIVLVTGLLSCGESPNNSKEPSSDSTKSISDSSKVLPAENWSYSQDTDKMTNEVKYYVENTSTNEIDFKFPYNGGSKFYLTVRYSENKNEVILQVSKGQFMTSISGEKTVKVKFDTEKPVEYAYNGTSDGSSTTIFIESSKKFISKLRTAKKLMIEAEFYDEGNKVIEFDVSGFQWKH